LILYPTDATSTLAGLSAIGVSAGFGLLIVNPSATIPITLLSQQSSTPAVNDFIFPSNGNIILPPLSQTPLAWLTGEGWGGNGSSSITQFYGTGIPFATVAAQYLKASIILDGVNTTFALTFPTAFADGQKVEVLSNTAVSVAFSVVGSGDGSTINEVPATTAAGTGIAWQYLAANTTWYRIY
jgi:hypothetical protein